jgi:hypothetical protein
LTIFGESKLWYPVPDGGTVGLLQWISVAIAILWTTGCAPFWTPEKVRTRDFESYALPIWTSDGMYFVSGRSGALFLTPPPMKLNDYRGVVFDEIQITTIPGSRELTPSEEKRLKGYFTRRLTYVFERNDWPIVDAPAEDVLRVRLAVRGVELGGSRRSHFGSVIAGVSRGQIGIALELRDGGKSERRLLFGDKRRLPFGTYAGSEAIAIRRVEDAFYYFSIDMRRRLKEARRGEFPPPLQGPS